MFETDVYFIVCGRIGFYKMLVKHDKIYFYSCKETDRPKWALCFSYMMNSSSASNFLSFSFKNKYLKDLDNICVENNIKFLKMVYVDGTVFYLYFLSDNELEGFLNFVYTRAKKSFSTLNIINLFSSDIIENIDVSYVKSLYTEKTSMIGVIDKINYLLGRSVSLPIYQPLYPNLFLKENTIRLMSENEVLKSFSERFNQINNDNEAKIRCHYSTTRLSVSNWSADQLSVLSLLYTDYRLFSKFCQSNHKYEPIEGHEGVYAVNILLENKNLRVVYLEWIIRLYSDLLSSNDYLLKNYITIQQSNQTLHFYNKHNRAIFLRLFDDIKTEFNKLTQLSIGKNKDNDIFENTITQSLKKSISKFSVTLKTKILQIYLFRNYRFVYTTADKIINQIRVDFSIKELVIEATSNFEVEATKDLICFLELHRVFITRSQSALTLNVCSFTSDAVSSSIKIHNAPITNIISTSQNNIVVSIDCFCKIVVWNFLSKKNALKVLKVFDVPFKSIKSIQFIEDDKLVMITNETNEIRIYNYFSTSLIKKIDANSIIESKIFWCSSPFVFVSFIDRDNKSIVYDIDNETISTKQLNYPPISTFIYKNAQGFYFKLVVTRDKIFIFDLPFLRSKRVVNCNTSNKVYYFHNEPNVLLSLQADASLVFMNFDHFELE